MLLSLALIGILRTMPQQKPPTKPPVNSAGKPTTAPPKPTVAPPKPSAPPVIKEVVVTKSMVLQKGALLNIRLVIKADGVVIDGNGATLSGLGVAGKPESYQGVGIVSEGFSQVTLKNIKAKGFSAGLSATDGTDWRVEGCDFSDNFTNPLAGWGNGERQGGMILTRITKSKFYTNKANRVWNGIDLQYCNENEFFKNDSSHCSNLCFKMLASSKNVVTENIFSYGIRTAPDEVHARDSACVLMESGSNSNRFTKNDMRYGGDGLFIRVLNGFVSTGNIFTENDCSYAHNNCVESWSPGNTFIRNKANHGSYGFWLGGSDQTVLMDNEAAFNGMPDENHNAPEPDFGHGGIVLVNGAASHTLIQGNYCHHNVGGGIVLRGDRESRGEKWRVYHCIIQGNRLEYNQWGIFVMHGDWIHVANNKYHSNSHEDVYDNVTNHYKADEANYMGKLPRVVMRAPKTAKVGEPVVFDATDSFSPVSDPVYVRWDLGVASFMKSRVTYTFKKPGFYRVSVLVHDSVLASLNFRDVLVTVPVTELTDADEDLEKWGYEMEQNNDGKAKVVFENDTTNALIGKNSIKFQPTPYLGANVTVSYPKAKDAHWNASDKTKLTFWIRAENPNPTGFQGAGPVIKLYGEKGSLTFTPAGDKHILKDWAYNEARTTWQRVEIPLSEADSKWKVQKEGNFSLADVRGFSFTFDSWESDPFTVWLDGVAFE